MFKKNTNEKGKTYEISHLISAGHPEDVSFAMMLRGDGTNAFETDPEREKERQALAAAAQKGGRKKECKRRDCLAVTDDIAELEDITNAIMRQLAPMERELKNSDRALEDLHIILSEVQSEQANLANIYEEKKDMLASTKDKLAEIQEDRRVLETKARLRIDHVLSKCTRSSYLSFSVVQLLNPV